MTRAQKVISTEVRSAGYARKNRQFIGRLSGDGQHLRQFV